MRIAVLVKQIPKFEEMELGADGRLKRDGIELDLNPYCRRAVSQGVALAAARPGSHVTVLTLGPPTAEDSLREAIAWGTERGVDIHGVDDLIRALDRDRIDRTLEMDVLRMGRLRAIDIHPVERKPSARQQTSR